MRKVVPKRKYKKSLWKMIEERGMFSGKRCENWSMEFGIESHREG